MHRQLPAAGAALLSLFLVAPVAAQGPLPAATTPAGDAQASPVVVVCSSAAGQEPQHCLADTSAGVVLLKSTGVTACLLGRTWGYDQDTVWVSDGCSGEFQLGQSAKAAAPGTATAPAAAPAAAPAEPRKPTQQKIESWGDFEPGAGFLLGRSKAGELAISGYALLRYVNQLPGEQTFTDHLGNTRTVDGRNDIWPHRIMVFLKGWLGTPKLIYAITFWTVLDTNQNAIFANIGYQFHRKFSVYGGFNGNPGTRSLQGSHPYWLGHDRVMADEFFRPFFTSGVWAQGELVPGLWYNAMLGDNNSILGVKSTQIDRKWTTGGSVWWMPTTKEFGPRGAYGDYEMHDKLATRFGFSTVNSPEERYTDSVSNASGNTTVRLADSVNVFDTGALAKGVTVNTVDYRILSFDAGVKYKGFFLQTEIYNRWLDNFKTDGVIPVSSIHDTGFYIQGAFYPIPKKLELYAATSQIFGDKSAGFSNSWEYLVGTNYYPFNSRNQRLNLQVIDVNKSPVSSSFGYYLGGQTGTTLSAAYSVFF
jgi:hypothetical protein